MKLHIAAGTVYLNGYTNVDLDLEHHHLVSERPDLVEANGTTRNNYYKTDVTKENFMSGEFHKKEVVVDEYADIKELSKYEGINEILGAHIFEHFTYEEGELLLNHWWDVMSPGGKLRLYMPDTLGIWEQYGLDGDLSWTLRQLYGSQKNEFGLHKAGYTFELMKRKMMDAGFKRIKKLDNINNYPAFGIEGERQWKNQ